jgi:hypothetical protein
MQQTVRLAATQVVAEQIAAMQERINAATIELIEEHTARVCAALEETRKELQTLREALNAQPAQRAKGPSSKRRLKMPMSGAQ